MSESCPNNEFLANFYAAESADYTTDKTESINPLKTTLKSLIWCSMATVGMQQQYRKMVDLIVNSNGNRTE